MKVKIGISACLLGANCSYKGESLISKFLKKTEANKHIEFIPFCPEDSVFGSPRANLRIVGGSGEDVLKGLAKVIDENGNDVTSKQIEGAHNFLSKLNNLNIGYAILMEGSPSCGSTIILNDESWPSGGFKKGVGVSAALLRKNNIKVLSSFDERDVDGFLSSVVDDYNTTSNLQNLSEMPKFQDLLR